MQADCRAVETRASSSSAGWVRPIKLPAARSAAAARAGDRCCACLSPPPAAPRRSPATDLGARGTNGPCQHSRAEAGGHQMGKKLSVECDGQRGGAMIYARACSRNHKPSRRAWVQEDSLRQSISPRPRCSWPLLKTTITYGSKASGRLALRGIVIGIS